MGCSKERERRAGEREARREPRGAGGEGAAREGGKEEAREKKAWARMARRSVSYTHLTLPTN